MRRFTSRAVLPGLLQRVQLLLRDLELLPDGTDVLTEGDVLTLKPVIGRHDSFIIANRRWEKEE